MSLVKINLPKATDEDKRTMAQQYGVNFILLHTKEAVNTDYRELSWQSVSVVPTSVGKKRSMQVVWAVNPLGAPKMDGALIFDPDRFGIGVAYVPDSPCNRNKLAACIYGGNEAWEIKDSKVDAEIRKLAKDMEKDPVLKAAEAQMVKDREANLRLVKEAEDRRRGKDVNTLDDKLKIITDALAQLTTLQLAQLKGTLNQIGEPAGKTEEPKRGRPAKPIEEKVITGKEEVVFT